MTIESIVGICFLAAIGISAAAFMGWCSYQADKDCEKGLKIGLALGAAAVLIVSAVICTAIGWWQLNSESGRRALKDQEANLNGGIERTVSVYDINGNFIQQYSGKFDIETDRESYILFDDEDGNRHIIYYTTGTVIVDES